MVAFNLVLIFRTTVDHSTIMLQKTCDSQASELNNQFKLVEQSVKNLYLLSEQFRPSLSELKDENVAAQYVEKFQEIAIASAYNTDGALAIYYRMNPEISNSGKTGFFWVKSPETHEFEENEATDISAYDENDIEHVGWCYLPIMARKAIWMEPYYNANIGVEMISYVTPIYDVEGLVGVVGIDVDFNSLIESAENIHIYESCGAVLCSLNDKKVYFNQSALLGDTIPTDIFNEMDVMTHPKKLLSTQINKNTYSYYFVTLNNDMKYLIYAEKNEIFNQARVTIFISLLIFSVVLFVTMLIAFRLGMKIVNPIGQIIEATKKYAQGDWSVKVQCDTNDELQLLTENISIMADKTQSYIRLIQDMAKKDTLTGLRNKNAYLLYVKKIENEHIKEKKKICCRCI